MSKPYRLIAVLIVGGAICFYAFRAEKDEPRPVKPPSEELSKGGSVQEDSGPPRSVPGAASAASAESGSGVPVPERLQDPRVLDPEPLKLSFAQPPFERRSDGRVFKTDEIRRGNGLHREGSEPEEDLQVLDAVIASYRSIFQQNPIAGENREVVEALTGRNPYQLVLLDPAHPALNAQNELTDRWGTPYRFHPLSGTQMEISSAGADRQFGTSDDVALENPAEIGGD